MRERWLGATGRKVPEIALEGSLELPEDTLVVDDLEPERLRAAHEAGTPVVARASDPEGVKAALERPEVAAVLVPSAHPELLELDLTELTYG